MSSVNTRQRNGLHRGRSIVIILFLVAIIPLQIVQLSLSVAIKESSLIPNIFFEDIELINPSTAGKHSSDENSKKIHTEEPITKESTVQRRQRPLKFYAIHIGPAKTGTSSIQKDFASNPFNENTFSEDKDNVIYIGKRFIEGWKDIYAKKEIRTINGVSITPPKEWNGHNKAIECMDRIMQDYYNNSTDDNRVILDNRLDTNEETRISLKVKFTNQCWKGKDYEYMLNFSIVDSAEEYSYSRGDIQRKLGERFRMFDILGYERLVVVGAYRRLAEWYVSKYTQWLKEKCLSNHHKQKRLPCPTIEEFLKQQVGKPGKYQSRKSQNLDITLPMIMEVGPSKLESKILNFFRQPNAKTTKKTNTDSDVTSYHSITTELYCDAFGMELMPHTCKYAQSQENLKDASARVASVMSSKNAMPHIANKGSFSNVAYQQIVAAGYRLGFLLFTEEELYDEEQRKEKGCDKGYYWCDSFRKCLAKNDNYFCKKYDVRQELDTITTNGKLPITRDNSSDIRTWIDLSQYHKKVHNATWTENLPIQCMSMDLLKTLLQKSLEFEELIMPKWYATPMGKAEHERLFWDVWLQEKKHFCWVDIERLFQNATSWDEIINKRMVNYNW